MKGEEDPDDKADDSFQSKSVWARISILFAGPLFNFIFAFVAAAIMIGIMGVNTPVIDHIDTHSAAYEAGIREGDTILSINGEKVSMFKELSLYNYFHQDDPECDVVYEREGEKQNCVVDRKMDETGTYVLGVSSSHYEKVTPSSLIPMTVYEMEYQAKSVFLSLKGLVTKQVKAKDISGPVGIVQNVSSNYHAVSPEGAMMVFLLFLNYAVLLNVNLGIMNLLPIPALDGGRIFLGLIEAVKGSPVKHEEWINAAGMAGLLVLMAVVMFSDIAKIF